MTNEEKDAFIVTSIDTATKIIIAYANSLEDKGFALQDATTGKKYIFKEIDINTELSNKIL